MKHYFRVVFHFPDGEEDVSDNEYDTMNEAICEGEDGVDGFSAGADVLALAGEEYYEGSATFEVEECWEDDNGEIVKTITHSF